MKNKSYSIKDIAREIGVSITTVSFVLNGKAEEKKISKIVTEKILNYAESINYRPSQLAQSLRTGKTKIIVFMVEDFYYFFAKLATIIESLAYKKGYKVMFCTNDNNDTKSIELINLYKNIKVDGYIIIPSPGLMPKIKELMVEKIPVILFDRYFPELDCNHIIVDNKEASYNATMHLINNKFKNIGFITTDLEQTQMLDRLNGYKEAINKNDFTEFILKVPLNEVSSTEKKDEEDIKKFIEENPQLDALYFATNYLAISGLGVMKKHFPFHSNNLGIISFDDLEFFEFYTPSITAISQPHVEIAQSLMGLMLGLIKEGKKQAQPKKITLKTNLKIRDSTVPR